jgi:hypothetical protein
MITDQSNIQSTLTFIYGYLLTCSTWRLSLNFIPVYYQLFLYWSQRGYFSIEVQSCTFLFSSTSRINPITQYTWLFLVSLRKQVVDRDESKTILWSLKNHPDNVGIWSILLSWHYSFCWGETTVLFLIRQGDTWSCCSWGQAFVGYTCRLLCQYSWVRRKAEEKHNSVLFGGSSE